MTTPRHSRKHRNPESSGLPAIDHLDIWTGAWEKKASGGRGRNGKLNPYGVQKLRELILELAVRGRLVPQDPNDEPASVLLEKIAEERARLVKEGKIRRQKKLPEIAEEETPFGLPAGWEYSRLGCLFEIQDYMRIPVNKAERAGRKGPYPYYGANGQVGTIDDFIFDGERVMVAEDGGFFYEPIRGVAYVAKGKFWANNHVHVLRCLGGSSPQFWVAYFNRMDWEPLVRGMTRAKLNQSALVNIVMPVPPLPEQHRIVAKVDELMALCDRLEREQTDSREAHQTLVETLLRALVEAPNAETAQQAWQRIAQHFHLLFTTEAAIDQLKQTILQLAVMGKLVPQDPNDEPASVLLERIAEEKVRLVKEGKIKRQKKLPEIAEEEKPFELPEGWLFARFEDIVDITSGVTKGRKFAGRKLITVPYLRVANVQRGGLDLEVLKTIDIPEEELEKYRVHKHDLLITEGGDWDKVGRTAIWHDEVPLIVHQNHVFKARIVLQEQNVIWIEKYLNSVLAREYFAKSSKQTTNLASINKTQLRGCLVAIPPLPEQHRIVAKVDELMALCDALKARIQEAETTQRHLADAVVRQAVM